MPDDNVPAATPHLPGGANVKALLESEGLGANGFSDGGPHESRQNQSKDVGRRSEQGRHKDQNHNGGCGQKHIGQPHQEQVHHTSEPSRKSTQQDTHNKGCRCADQSENHGITDGVKQF